MKKQIFLLLAVLFAVCLSATHSYAQIDEVESNNALLYYSGTFNQHEKVEFNLELRGNSVTGSYIFEKSGDLFVFNGRMANDRKGIGVVIFDHENSYIGTIEAKFISEESNFGKSLTGIWKSANGKLTKRVDLKKVAEYASIEVSSEDNSGYSE